MFHKHLELIKGGFHIMENIVDEIVFVTHLYFKFTHVLELFID
jgi:hypothetical protein